MLIAGRPANVERSNSDAHRSSDVTQITPLASPGRMRIKVGE